jgi:hypothetical protein
LDRRAGVAQLVEQLICNQPVASSSLVTSLILEGQRLYTNVAPLFFLL